ncbi:MAG: divalent-cation tolerance protein CutA [Candidatus Hydrothermarchaeaceae archaeon]
MHVIVYITASNIKEAKDLVEVIVKERLAACANVVERVESVYWWKGTLEKDNESLIILKTREDKLDELIERVRQLHSYENPEIVAVPILKGSAEYLKWIDDELNPKH